MDITVIVLDGAFSAGVSTTLEVLAAAKDAAHRAGLAPITWRVCSVYGGAVKLSSGFTLDTQQIPRAGARGEPSWWIIPGIAVYRRREFAARLVASDVTTLCAAIERHLRGGGRVAATCASVFLLAQANALQARRATTSWWLARYLQEAVPSAIVDADRMVCVDGPITTAGAAFAQIDLMLHVVAKLRGPAFADQLARLLVIDARDSQAAFVSHRLLAPKDALVQRVIQAVEEAMPERVTVEQLAREFAMSTRTLSRHVFRETGLTTKALIQGIRLQRARGLIEGTARKIEDIAADVGFQDATAFRRMVRRLSGVNPSRYRR